MSRELQGRVLEVLERTTGRRVYSGPTPGWLQHPGRAECGPAWRTVRRIYRDLTGGMELPDEMPPRERREVDGVMGGRGWPAQLVEVDESQHFNAYRALTLDHYPAGTPLGFPRDVWLDAARAGQATRGGGWAKPTPPLFPHAGGRHLQRAFRDALADLLPPLYGYAPTLRIADFEVEAWIWDRGAAARLALLVDDRLATRPESPVAAAAVAEARG